MTRFAVATARAAATLALALALAAAPARAQTPGFEGAYKLTLSFGPSCAARIPSLSVTLTLRESKVTQGSEVTARPARSDEQAVAQAILLRSGTSLHGGFSSQGGGTQREPITSGEGWFFLPWLVLDGTVTTTADRPQAKGTAFGFLSAGLPEEDYPSSLARCTVADFSWTLDPQ